MTYIFLANKMMSGAAVGYQRYPYKFPQMERLKIM